MMPAVETEPGAGQPCGHPRSHTDHPFGCGSNRMSDNWDLPTDRRFTYLT